MESSGTQAARKSVDAGSSSMQPDPFTVTPTSQVPTERSRQPASAPATKNTSRRPCFATPPKTPVSAPAKGTDVPSSSCLKDTDDPEIAVPVDPTTCGDYPRIPVSSAFRLMKLDLLRMEFGLKNKHLEVMDAMSTCTRYMKEMMARLESNEERLALLWSELMQPTKLSDFEAVETTGKRKRPDFSDSDIPIGKRVRSVTGRNPRVSQILLDYQRPRIQEGARIQIPAYILKEFMCCEQENRIVEIINSCADSDVLATIKGVEITKKDLEKLTLPLDQGNPSTKWLDDKIVDARIHDLREQVTESIFAIHKKYFGDTGMFIKLIHSGQHVQEDVRLLDASAGLHYLIHDMIFIPMCVRNHWFLTVVDVPKTQIEVLNSQKTTEYERTAIEHVVRGLERHLKYAAKGLFIANSSWPNLDVTKWDIKFVLGVPQQEDDMSCGLYMLKYFEYWNGERIVKVFTQIFFPINVGNKHWYLAVINARLRTIQVLDSAGPTENRLELTQTLIGLESYLTELQPQVRSKCTKWKDLNVASWPLSEEKCPLQTDGSSCGVFTLKNMELWTGTSLSPYFTQEDIDNFRQRLPVLLVDSKINKIPGGPKSKLNGDGKGLDEEDPIDVL